MDIIEREREAGDLNNIAQEKGFCKRRSRFQNTETNIYYINLELKSQDYF